MKKIVIGAVVLVLVSQAISAYYLNRRFRLMACGVSYYLCEQRCDTARDNALRLNEAQRLLAAVAYNQARFNCIGEHAGDNAALTRCAQEAERAFSERMASLDASDAAAIATREQCGEECSRRLHACDAANAAALSGSTGAVAGSVNVVGNVTVDCVEGGAPCFKPVSDFCQRASGACDQCWLSLCGGGEWVVEPVGEQLPLSTTLVAATDPSKSPRVLATSAARGNQAVLNVPPDIKLGGGEQLYFGFSSRKRPGGPVEVRIHRSR
jgi:hypothetical protein